MALQKCPECGNEISTEAKVCPHCGAKKKMPLVLVVISAIVFAGGVLFFLGALDGPRDEYVAHEVTNIYQKVADDAVAQYGIAKRQGDKMQICVQAGFVTAAFLQAKDEANYGAWKETQKADCHAAGVPIE